MTQNLEISRHPLILTPEFASSAAGASRTGNIPSAEDKGRAVALNDAWDRARRGEQVSTIELSNRRIYPAGSVGHCYNRALAIREKSRADVGKAPMSREQKSRDDWPRAWK
jgi:hypothetical protein